METGKTQFEVKAGPPDELTASLKSAKKADSAESPKTDYSAKAVNSTSFSDYWRIFTYSTSWDRVFLACAFLTEIGVGATLPLMNVIFGQLVGSFNEYFIPGATITKQEFQKSLNQQTLYVVYLFIARWGLSYFSIFVFRMVGLRMSALLRLEYLKALFRLPVSSLDTLPSGQASNTLTNTANLLQLGVSEKLGMVIQNTSLLVSSCIVAFTHSWNLTLVTSSVLLFMGSVYGVVIPLIIKAQKEVDFADEKASSIAGEVLSSIRMIVACGAEQRVTTKYAGWVDESKKRGLKMAPLTGIQFAPVFFSVFATMALCFWYGFRIYVQGKIDNVGEIVIVLMSVMFTAMALGATAGPITQITKAATAATDFFAIIDAPKPKVTGLKESDVSANSDIKFESVTFAYPSRPHVKVLDDLNLYIQAGKKTALVGSSGSGKSTIVGLMERWYELDVEKRLVLPKSVVQDDKAKKAQEVDSDSGVIEEVKEAIGICGSVTIGGHNLDDIELRWWRSQIGLVQQEPFIFNDTIFRNVEYGMIGSQWENEDGATKKMLVEEACQEAFADEFINRLPMGYETQVGDAGIKLSGGQRQRLAIARSIVKRPKILILDEATSAIDVRGEGIVQAALDRVSEGRTTITIAHRLSTIKKADKIVVLKKGKVVEEGTHESLLANESGAYWALVNAQKISMGEGFAAETDLVEGPKLPLKQIYSASQDPALIEADITYKPQGLFNSFGLLLWEQRSHWKWYSILFLGCLGAASGNPIQSYLFASILSVTQLIDPQALIKAANLEALKFFILAIGVAVAYYLLGFSSTSLATHISCTYRQQYFENVLYKPITFYDDENTSSGTLTARLANDPTQLQQMLGINMAMVWNALLSLTGCVIIGFCFGWKLTLLTVFVSTPIIMTAGFFRVRYEIQFESLNQAVFAESSKFAAESIGAFRTVTSMTMEDMIARRYEMLLQDHVSKAFKKSRFTVLLFAASDSIALLCMALTFYYGGKLLADREYDPTQFFVVYIAVVMGSESAGSILSFGPNMAQASAAANRILSFRTVNKAAAKVSSELKDTEGGIKIELQNLHFKYPTRDTPIFSDLNLTIEKGQFAGLVGSSGSGKTSIVSLLERFYDVQKGKIICNGMNIVDLDIQTYRKTLSLVAQEPTLFQGTIRDNVLLGVEESIGTEQLHAACRDAEIHDFIESLPEGYNTEVGNRGITLSGGQKQRIAIARALIRDPKILLLDEATSSLDSESEKLVQAAFERAAKNRTMVVVAHRLATVQNADVIFVLGEGNVLEKGSHEQLLRMRGVYYQMCQSQALDR